MKRPATLAAGEHLVLTANTLLEGDIVWRTADGRWSRHIADAERLDAENAQTTLEGARAHAQRDGLVGVYDVVVRTGFIPATMRERIRAFGPSVRPDFAVSDKP